MVIDIKMCRFDNVPWGFRLVGGADYEYPLTVVKVSFCYPIRQFFYCSYSLFRLIFKFVYYSFKHVFHF